MSESREKAKYESGVQEVLMEELISGKIPFKKFLDRIEELDQSIPTRDHAEENVRVLTDPVIVKIAQRETDVEQDYYLILSLSFFHVGQRKLADGKTDAKQDFLSALNAAEKMNAEGDEQWRLYIRATIAYLEKDIFELENLHQQMDDRGNKNIVSNFILGLRNFGEIDYRRDYRNK